MAASMKIYYYAFLTLQKHANGIWMTKLLQEFRENNDSSSIVAKVVILEDYCAPSPSFAPENWSVLVNRVSDAAPPPLVKKCTAILCAARLWGIPVFNEAYTLGASKWLHHVALQRAGLNVPASVVVDRPSANKTAAAAVAIITQQRLKFPVLLKPNSGGFGAGIVKFRNLEELDAYYLDGANHSQACSSNTTTTNEEEEEEDDGVYLLQEYVAPRNNTIHRVWFLRGRVQCAVQRQLPEEQKTGDEFLGGCAAACMLPSRNKNNNNNNKPQTTIIMKAWAVPKDVEEEIEGLLRVLHNVLENGLHAGSVEFLCDNESGKRWYFDLNLLSTLPIVDTVHNADQVWPKNYNPWAELAHAIHRLAQEGEK